MVAAVSGGVSVSAGTSVTSGGSAGDVPHAEDRVKKSSTKKHKLAFFMTGIYGTGLRFNKPLRLKKTSEVWRDLPALVNLGANLIVIDALDLFHYLWVEGGQIGCLGIVKGLLPVLGAGYGAAYGIEHQYPAQSELSQCNAVWHQWAQLLNCVQSRVIIHAREGFPYVKDLAVPVEAAMIIGAEFGLATHFPAEQAAGERHAG